ncbi:MAG TPA: type VI secretion system tube protein Hcp [Pyrinomonadaceae bacterium]|nr:type VI secretion system tube protein Hcp [Pyrinomonadaceae bacterium]
MDVLIMDMGDGVKGESSLPGYKEKIELLTFVPEVGAQSTGRVSGSERTSGRAAHQGFTVTKYMDAASPVLQQALIEGKRFPQVSVVIGHQERGGIQELMHYKMSDVIVSNFSISGGAGEMQVETWTFNYDKITSDFHPRA